jgi:hypothetical protein
MEFKPNFKKSLYSFISLFLNDYDLKFKVYEESETPLLVIVLDVAKIDKNSGSYDENYHSKIFRNYHQTSGMSRFLYDFISKYNELLNAIKNYFDVDFRLDYEFVNYDYLDEIENDINEKLKQSEYPNVTADFTNESKSPIIYLRFKSLEKSRVDEFRESLNEILPGLILKDNYSVSINIKR